VLSRRRTPDGAGPFLGRRFVVRVDHGRPAELVLEAAVVDLAHAGREVAVGLEVLLERRGSGDELARRTEVSPDLRLLRPPPGEQRRAARAAERVLAV